MSGRRLPLSAALVQRVVEAVLAGGAPPRHASRSPSWPGRHAPLNAAHKGHDRPTDVLSFALDDPIGR